MTVGDGFPLRVWAPGRVTSRRRPGRSARCTASDGSARAGGSPRSSFAHGHRLHVQPRWRRAAAQPTLALAAARRRRAVAHRRSRRASSGRRRLPGTAAGSRRSSTSCTSARSAPRARSMARSPTSTTSSSSASRIVELMPVAEFPGRSRLGLRRRRPVRATPRLRRPGGPHAPRRRGALPAGLAVILDVVYNHLGPAGNYLPRVRPVLHRQRYAHAVGQRRQP